MVYTRRINRSGYRVLVDPCDNVMGRRRNKNQHNKKIYQKFKRLKLQKNISTIRFSRFSFFFSQIYCIQDREFETSSSRLFVCDVLTLCI